MTDILSNQTIAFIGCGKLGTPILQRLSQDDSLNLKFRVSVNTEESKTRLQSLLSNNKDDIQIRVQDTATTIDGADIIILACKSTQYRSLLQAPGIASSLSNKILVALQGGVTVPDIQEVLGSNIHCTIIRALANVAALVGESITLLSECSNTDALELVRQLFLQVGSVHVLPAEKIEAAAVVTASGPAFFAFFLESVRKPLSGMGFENEEARVFAAGSMKSCAELVLRAGWEPEEVMKKVATKGGSTERGLNALEGKGVKQSIAEAIGETFEKALKLGEAPKIQLTNGVSGVQDGNTYRSSIVQAPDSMKAVVLKGVRKIAVEESAVPKIEEPNDIIVRVKYSGLCGSDLHLYRGVEDCGTDFSMGHEFTGTVIDIGNSVSNFQIGDEIVSPFTITCGDCYYCKNGLSSRCEACQVYGTPNLGGAQAQYVRVPRADTTAFKALKGIHPQNLILMADIFPTGFYAVSNGISGLSPPQVHNSTIVVIGCGPVGLCAISVAGTHKPKHLIAVDAVPSRLENAASLGAEPRSYKDEDALMNYIKDITDGRGADIVLELVGAKSALQLAFDLVRPGGVISSIGVHSTEFPFTASQGYDKNIRLQMGRCPVRSVFAEALDCLSICQDKLGFLTETIVPLSDAVEWYEKFDRMEVQKVIFDAER